MTFQQVIDGILGNLGVLVLLLVILYGGYKRWWVFGWYATELKARNERLENRIDKISGAAKSVTTLAETVTSVAEKTADER